MKIGEASVDALTVVLYPEIAFERNRAMKKFSLQDRLWQLDRLVKNQDLAQAAAGLIDFQRDYDVDDRYLTQVQSVAFALNDLDREGVEFGRKPAPTTLTPLLDRLCQLSQQIAQDYGAIIWEGEVNQSVGLSVSQSEKTAPVDDAPLIMPTAEKAPSTLVFRGTRVSKTYESRRLAFTLHPINLELHLGEITTVVGENGNGKTTLLRAIAGLHPITSGTLSYPMLAPDSNPLDWYRIKQQMTFISQELPQWRGNVIDNLRFAAAIHGLEPAKIDQTIDLLITRLRLDPYRHARWKELSGGYKMRFALAKALIVRPKLLIIDEPLANLDVNAQITFLDDLRTFAASPRNPMAVLLTSQHLHEVERVADNIIFLRQGKAMYSGATKEFGVERAENCFELASEATLEDLTTLLQTQHPDTRVLQTGYNFLIYTPVTLSREALLRVLLDNHVAITYFRDISQSTRQLFTEPSVH